MSEVEEIMKRVSSHKGVTGAIIIDKEGMEFSLVINLSKESTARILWSDSVPRNNSSIQVFQFVLLLITPQPCNMLALLCN